MWHKECPSSICTYTCVYVGRQICMYVHTYTHYIYACIHTCKYMHISIHKYTDIQRDVSIYIYFCNMYFCTTYTVVPMYVCLNMCTHMLQDRLFVFYTGIILNFNNV